MGDQMNQPAAKDDPLRGMKTGKWTKYGGAISGLKKERIEDHWYCQMCGDEIPKEIKPFLIEMFPGDFIRICSRCTHTATLVEPTTTVMQIISITRTIRTY